MYRLLRCAGVAARTLQRTVSGCLEASELLRKSPICARPRDQSVNRQPLAAGDLPDLLRDIQVGGRPVQLLRRVHPAQGFGVPQEGRIEVMESCAIQTVGVLEQPQRRVVPLGFVIGADVPIAGPRSAPPRPAAGAAARAISADPGTGAESVLRCPFHHPRGAGHGTPPPRRRSQTIRCRTSAHMPRSLRAPCAPGRADGSAAAWKTIFVAAGTWSILSQLGIEDDTAEIRFAASSPP